MNSKELNKLVSQLQNGDLAVFDFIYHETKSVVYYTILGIVKDKSLAEDIMQDTYLKSLEKIHSFKPRFGFKSWIVTIARNLSINEYNRRKRELSFDPSVDEYIFGQEESTSEKELIVRDVLEYLDETEREVIIMHVLGDLKHREIADLLKKPIGTITWIYNKAIKKAKEKFRE
ncbi:ECF RNA polymerase sigma factor SigR [Candidatus Izimaplasma bacterium HR1]|jgi:RNA polymerase sigma-70 factor (ECF subfamily)|uniref:RNA polymerase sigma factor n=1 Tax=Candidatus Izimoplasma sp. HR1 TaxID=1541959 RepID=UPI0004F6F8DB|nr:ECF RNA polymerase sigma factor SigR [Candidatus Izimaplasma bacterium HR1]